MLIPDIKKLVGERDRISAKDYNRRGRVLQSVSRSISRNSISDSSGLHGRSIIRAVAGDLAIKLVRIHSKGTGDGIYNCYELTIDAIEWADTVGDSKFDDKDAVSLEVFNLYENDPIHGAGALDYVPALGLYDRLIIWKKKDDANNDRWIGIPITPQIRFVIAAEDAPATDVDETSITCNLVLNDEGESEDGELGYGIEVFGSCVGGTEDWDDVLPLITNDSKLTAQCINGRWAFTTEFFPTTSARKAFCKTDAGPSADIVVYLDIDGSGEEVTVDCNIAGGGNLDKAIPRLTDGLMISVEKLAGTWYCKTTFQAIDDTELQIESGKLSTKLFEC